LYAFSISSMRVTVRMPRRRPPAIALIIIEAPLPNDEKKRRATH
jgi:hypothetical protein